MKNKKQTLKFNKSDMQLLAIIALLIVLITFVFSVALLPVYAEEYTEIDTANFDNTNVLDDLNSAENFDIENYPTDSRLDAFYVQNVVEYCYSSNADKRGRYGVYVYLYNPSQKQIDTTSYDNKIQLAIGYGDDGKPNNYEKFSLKFCSVSNGNDNKYLFYKFKIIDQRSNADNKTIAERVDSNARRYDFAGIELLQKGNVLSVDYPVEKTYTFTGYAAGYNPDESILESTLQCQVKKLTTLTLKVEHTFYRTKTSDKGADYQNQIDTVYFSVPKEYFDNYGELQRIKAEWYEYKTKPIIVTSNRDFYDKVLPFISKSIGTYEKAALLYSHLFKSTSYNKDNLDYGIGVGFQNNGGNMYPNYELVWNVAKDTLTERYLTQLFYLLYCEDINNYDPYADFTQTGGLSGNDLYNYILTYTKTYDSGKLPIKNGFISADLFEADIDDYRKVNNEAGKIDKGYSCYDFDADVDLKHLNTWQSSNPTIWDNFREYGLWDTIFGNIPKEEAIDLAPIVDFNFEDLKLSNEELVAKYYINAKDVNKFKDYARTAQRKNEKVVLFRFATSDYYIKSADIVQGVLGVRTSGQAYIAQESVFFNFDIIQLTFRNNDKYTIIPIVSSPIDIVNDPTPPTNIKPETKNILTIILTVLLLVFALIVIVKVIIWLVKALTNPPATPNTKSKSNKKEYQYRRK